MSLSVMLQVAIFLQCDGIVTWPSSQQAARTTIEIDGDLARIRPPQGLDPGLSGPGDDGWRNLTDVEIADGEVRARFSYNWLSKPLVIIDRYTGDIEIRGGDALAGRATFRGDCQPVSRQRLF